MGSPRCAAELSGKTAAEVPGLGELMVVWVRLRGLSGWSICLGLV